MLEQSQLPVEERIKPTIVWSSIILLPLVVLLLLTPYNKLLFLFLNQHIAVGETAAVWAMLTNLGDGFFLFPLVMVLFFRMPDQQRAVIISVIVLALTVNLSKHLIGTLRPAMVLESGQLSVIGPVFKYQSLPSGHSATVFLVAGLACLFMQRRLIILVLILMALVGVSRVVVGAHWPADVVFGAWIGLVCAAAGSWVSHKSSSRLVTRLLFIVLGVVAFVVLPNYQNGFSLFPEVILMQYLLALIAGVSASLEVTALCADHREKLKHFLSQLFS